MRVSSIGGQGRRGALRFWPGLLSLFLAVLLLVAVAGPAVPARAETAYSAFYVYFPLYLQTGIYVYPVRYLVPKTDTPAHAAMEALVAGLPGNGGIRLLSLPKDAGVLSVSIKDGVCTVDFSEEIRKVNVGSGGEAAIISAIVSTLGQFPSVQSVDILVEGRPVETLAGHVDISGPIPVEDRVEWFNVLSDVHQHWSGGAVAALQVMDVVNGYEDGTFRPEQLVSRAEFIKMLVEGLGFGDAPSQDLPFKDVSLQWHASYIRRALAASLIKASDYGDYLKPDEVIPREEMAYLLVAASAAYVKDHPQVKYPVTGDVPSFSDFAETQERFRPAVQECVRLSFLRGFPDGTFAPKSGLKRAEAVAVISRVLGMVSTKDAFGIIRMNPLAGAEWEGGPLTMLGAAAAFEGNVNFRLSGADGEELMYGYTTTASGMGWGVFGLHIDPGLFAGKTVGLLQVLLVSAKDGHEYSNVPWYLEAK